MSDLNWCTFCDKAIDMLSSSLYCSEECLRKDALHCHPMLGYDYAELKDFPRATSLPSPALSPFSTASTTSMFINTSPALSPLRSSAAYFHPASPPSDKHSKSRSPPLFTLDQSKHGFESF